MHFNPDVFTLLSSLEIRLHWATAFVALLLGGAILLRPIKGDRLHRICGAIYVTLMLVTIVSAFLIRRGDVTGWSLLTFEGMTWIHLFVPLTLWGIVGGLHGILVLRDPAAHRPPLVWSYVGGLIIAGSLTLLPDRRVHATFFWTPEQVEAAIERRR